MPRRKRRFVKPDEEDSPDSDNPDDLLLTQDPPLHPTFDEELTSTSAKPAGEVFSPLQHTSSGYDPWQAGTSDMTSEQPEHPYADLDSVPPQILEKPSPIINVASETTDNECGSVDATSVVTVQPESVIEAGLQTSSEDMILCSGVTDSEFQLPCEVLPSENEEDNMSVFSEDGSIYYDVSSDSEEFADFCSSIPSGEEPLYSNADVSFQMALVALLTLVMTHRLTKECVNDLLSLLKMLLPKDNILVQSSYLFFSNFEKYQSSFVKHFYCSACSESLPSPDAICPKCGPGKGANFFIQFSIMDQIQKLFSTPDFFNNLQYSKTRVKKNAAAYEDIYDGNVYKEANRLFFSVSDWISLMWNTDGFSVFKSSLFSVWPFYLAINELPPNLRLKKENMILGGLWFGTGKFDPNLFLKPIHDELCRLREGFNVKVHSLVNLIKLHVALLCGTCDVPAKSCFFCHIGFNGLHGCLKCLSRGLKSAASGQVFVYPFEEILQLRTDESYLRHVAATEHSNKPVFGVQGPSYLQKMLLHSVLPSISIDIMHGAFLGVQKTLMHLWFDKSNKNEEFSLFTCTDIVNDYLHSIRPPHFLQRCAQSLKKLAFWKASEYESFFFFYSLPILSVVMNSVFFNHFMLLYLGLSLLCQESILESDIILSQNLLDEYVKKYQQLYGLRHMTHNLHGLRHLPKLVQDLGPLWATTCYLFEDLNGTLKHLVHGTQHVGLQVQSNFELATNLSRIIKSCPSGVLKDFSLKMYSPLKRLNVTHSINQFACIVGPIVKELNLDPIIRQIITNVPGNVSYFKRLRLHSCLYVIAGDSKGRKLSNVIYNLNNAICYGILQAFLKVTQCTCTEVCDCSTDVFYAVVKRYDTETAFHTLIPPSPVMSVLKCSESDLVDIVSVNCLHDVCVNVSFNEQRYIVKRPYRLNLQ